MYFFVNATVPSNWIDDYELIRHEWLANINQLIYYCMYSDLCRTRDPGQPDQPEVCKLGKSKSLFPQYSTFFNVLHRLDPTRRLLAQSPICISHHKT